jgi:hypothetical protein
MDVVVVGRTVWAVGGFRKPGHRQRTLAAQWNGHRWRVYPGPRGGLQAVDGIAGSEIWAVGPGKDVEPQRAILRRWDGRSWTTVRQLSNDTALLDVVVAPPRDAWAVGYRGAFPYRPLIMRRHGSPWRVGKAPHVKGRLWAVDGTPHNLWALRWYTVGDSGRLDTYHRC